MNPTLVKSLVALIPTCMLLFGASVISFRAKSLASRLQLFGAGALMVMVISHICEALNVFPWMHWGLEHSAGHYLDALAALLGFALFPTGYLFDALRKRPF